MDPRVVARLELSARVAGGLVAALGLAALAGWWLDVIVLRQLHPSLEPMKANVALALTFIGVAIVLIARGTRRLNTVRILGALAAIIGGLTLLEHATQWNLRIDELLVDDADDPTAPGRMSIATAVDLLFASLAILTLDLRSKHLRYPAEWTVFGIVTQSGGGIAVESEPSKGTSFKIYLPYAPDAEIATREKDVLVGPPSRGGETVLLVEDDEQLLRLLSTLLTDAGYGVLQAKDGEDAIIVSKGYGGPIHLLLTDVVMPRMGGRELAERIAAEKPSISILFMSGHTDDAILHHGVRTHEMAFVHKPVDPDALLGRIREVLDEKIGKP